MGDEVKFKVGSIDCFPSIDKIETGKIIRKYMDNQGLSVKDVKDYLKLGSVQSIYHWLEGKTMPSTDNFFALSILLGVTVDDLIYSKYKPPQIYYDYVNNAPREMIESW